MTNAKGSIFTLILICLLAGCNANQMKNVATTVSVADSLMQNWSTLEAGKTQAFEAAKANPQSYTVVSETAKIAMKILQNGNSTIADLLRIPNIDKVFTADGVKLLQQIQDLPPLPREILIEFLSEFCGF